MRIIRFIFGISVLSLAIVIPFTFYKILFFIVQNIGIGWVFATILIRVSVILLFAIALKQFFTFFIRLKKLKFRIVFLIAILPGFGISFLSPIYNTDYGLMNDDFKLVDHKLLSETVQKNIIPKTGYVVCAFFTTTCPHCMAASQKLGANIEAGQKTPVFAFFPGTEGDSDDFLSKYHGQAFNTSVIDNDSLFVALSGGAFPSIFLINQKGETEYHWTGDEMNYSALDYLKSLEQ